MHSYEYAEKNASVFSRRNIKKLKMRSKEEKTSVSDIVRNAVCEFLKGKEKKDWERDPSWNMVGAGKSGKKDLSVNHDKYLYCE